MIDVLLPILLAFLVVTVSPGPANIATASVAMRFGRAHGLVFGLGLSAGLAFWGVIAASGMGAVLQVSSNGLTALKLAGGLYLLWLAYQSGRDAVRGQVQIGVVANNQQGRWFMRGLWLNLSNPKAVVAWMAALSMGLGSDSNGGAVVLATATCGALGVLNYTVYALVFSMPQFISGYRRCHAWIDGLVCGLFAIAGLGLIRSALSRQ